jgi:integrase
VRRFEIAMDASVRLRRTGSQGFLERLVTVGWFRLAVPGAQALVFWFKQALGKELGDLGDFQKSKRPRCVPVVLTRSEVGRLLAAMEGDTALMAGLLYGSGLRLQELITLRIKDLDLERRQIAVREGKGRKDRLTVLPERSRDALLARASAHDLGDRLSSGTPERPSLRHWSGSTLARRGSGRGSSSSLPRASASSRGQGERAATIWMRASCRRL